MEILSRAPAKGQKSLNFGIFIGRFPSGGAASMTVKGLRAVEVKGQWKG